MIEATIILSLVWVTGALAQGDSQDADLRKRLEEAEKRIGELEKRKQTESGLKVEFKDGLKVKSEDGNFNAHVGGRLLTHYRFVQDRPEGAGTRSSPDTFFVRQARLEMSGDFYKDYEFKVQIDFPTGATSSTTGTLTDGYLGWKKYPELSLRIGQFKEPFSQEETTSTRFIDFVERSVVNRLVPARDIGLMIHGRLFEKILEYEAALYNGQGRAVLDGNDEKDAALRLRVTPFVSSENAVLKNLRVGVAGTIGDFDSSSISGLDLTTTELGITFLDATTGSIDGRRTRLGVELSWLCGPFGVRGEWLRRSTEVDIGANEDEEIDAEGWYLAATWLLSGEDKPLENRVVPAHPLDLGAGHWGAFELAFRIAAMEVDEDIFDLGIAPAAANSNEVQTLTFGVNWYLTRNFRVSPNVILERFDDDIDFGNGRTEDSAWGALVRFQIDF